VTVSDLTDVVSVAGGGYHSLALKADGTVRTWGAGYVGQLGDGGRAASTTPVTVRGLTDVVSVAGGEAHSLALQANGSVWAWGYNESGQLGKDTSSSIERTMLSELPVTVSGLTDVVSVAGGGDHSLALKADGSVLAWGRNGYGELGNGTGRDSIAPVTVSGLTGVAQPTP
jgi:alpha-tubulin suppressor-like RCC1 family protein